MSQFQIQITAQDECALCQDYLVEPVFVIPCNHVFCRDCLMGMHAMISLPPCPICRQPTESMGYIPVPICIEVYSSVINTGEADNKYAHAWFNIEDAMIQPLHDEISIKSIADAYQKKTMHHFAPLDVFIKAVEINQRFGKAWARIAECLNMMELKEFTQNSFKYEIVACLEAALSNTEVHCSDLWQTINNWMVGAQQESITLKGHTFSRGEVIGNILSGVPLWDRYSYRKIGRWHSLCAWMCKFQNDISLVESSMGPSVLIDGKKHGVLDCKFAILKCYLSAGLKPDRALVESLIQILEHLGMKTYRDPYGEKRLHSY